MVSSSGEGLGIPETQELVREAEDGDRGRGKGKEVSTTMGNECWEMGKKLGMRARGGEEQIVEALEEIGIRESRLGTSNFRS